MTDDYAAMDGVSELDEIDMGEIKINPDYYIHNAILKAQTALSNPNMKEGFVQYRLFIEHIEVLCKAANMLSNDYESNLKTFKESDQDYLKENDSLIKNTLLANKKMQLLMNEVFSNKTSRVPLKI